MGLKTLIFMSKCIMLVLGTYTYIAGYEPQSDVVQHARIDLDVQAIISLLPDADGGDLKECPGNSCDWDSTYRDELMDAWYIWENGKFSAKSNSNRSIGGFSKGAETKSSGNNPATDVNYKDNKYISVMNAYWSSKGLNAFTWGYDIINATFYGKDISGIIDMSQVGDDFRREVIQKGIVYFNVFPYVIWEMQDAINDCNAGRLNTNDMSVHAWDEAVAFYTGTLEGVSQGGNNGLDSCIDGGCELQFMLADKRCTNFGTCTADFDLDDFAGYSKVNYDIFKLFTKGRDQILGANHTKTCPDIDDTMNQISGLMLVPFIQGVQRYLYKTSVGTPSAKQAGELFAFATAVLPFIDQVDHDAAELLYNRAWKLDYTTTEDWKDIKYAIEDTYRMLGVDAGVGMVTCAQVGELTESGNVLSKACIDPVESEKKSTSVEGWVIAIIVILCVVLIVVCIYMVFIRREYTKVAPLIDANKRAKAKEGATRDFSQGGTGM